MIKTCCSPFERLLQNTGMSGVSIIPRIEFGRKYFILQSRVFDRNISEYLCRLDPKTGLNKFSEVKDEKGNPIPIALASSIAILYCPYCGKKLDDIIKDNIGAFDELVDKMKMFSES